MPKVSVIIPCYNLGQYLDEAVDSVLSQTHQDFEIIIINDGSTDDFTNELLKEYERPKTTIYHTTNQGLPATRNYGIERASGNYICCLDADDKYHPKFLEKTVPIFDNDIKKEYGIVSTWVEVFGENEFTWKISDYDPVLLFEGNPLHVASLIRKKNWEMAGGYKTNLKGYQDWDFWINLVSKGYKWSVIKEILFYYRVRENSMVKVSDKNRITLIGQIVDNNYDFFSRHVKHIMLNMTEKGLIIKEKDRQIIELERELALVKKSSLYRFFHKLGLID